jgi:hypothetical protein
VDGFAERRFDDGRFSACDRELGEGDRHAAVAADATVPLVRLPGQAARAIRFGANPAPDRAIGRRVWEAFVAKGGTHPVASRV